MVGIQFQCAEKKISCDSIMDHTPCIAVIARLGMIGAQLFFLTCFVSKVIKVSEPVSSIARNNRHKKDNFRVNSFYQQRHNDSTKLFAGYI